MDNRPRRNTPPRAVNQDKTVVRQKPVRPRTAPARVVEEIDHDYERSVNFANRGCLLAFVSVVLAGLAVLLIGFLYIKGELDGKHASATGIVTVEVLPNSGGQRVGQMLEENGLIGSQEIFRFFVRLNGVTGFKSGEFEITAGMSYNDIIDALTLPPPERETMKVTFPEGWSVVRFARECERVGLCSAEDFLYEANHGDFPDIPFLQQIDYQPNTFMRAEGYLFPSTYDFYVDSTAHEVVEKLFRQFQTQLDKGINTTAGVVNIYSRMEEQGINLRQMVTLASLVEKEASVSAQDMIKVSGVFWNRLTTDHPNGDFARRTMGADATTRYLADFVAQTYGVHDYTDWTLEDMTNDMLSYIPHELFYAYYTVDSDPNSIEGLPAGPIGCPGMAAITAALFPEKHNYYYFVTDAKNEFRYATNYSQHLNNVRQAEAVNAQAEKEEAAA